MTTTPDTGPAALPAGVTEQVAAAARKALEDADAKIEAARAEKRQVLVDLRQEYGLTFVALSNVLGLSATYCRELYNGRKSSNWKRPPVKA